MLFKSEGQSGDRKFDGRHSISDPIVKCVLTARDSESQGVRRPLRVHSGGLTSNQVPSSYFTRLLAVPRSPTGLIQVRELAQEDLCLPEASVIAVVEGGGDEQSPSAGLWIFVEVLSDDEPHGRVRQGSVVMEWCRGGRSAVRGWCVVATLRHERTWCRAR